MTQLDTGLSALTANHERLQKRSSRELRQLHEQIAILKDGMSQLSDAMLEEFTSIRKDMQHQATQLQCTFEHSLQKHKLLLETDLADFKATCIDADLGGDLRRIEEFMERIVQEQASCVKERAESATFARSLKTEIERLKISDTFRAPVTQTKVTQAEFYPTKLRVESLSDKVDLLTSNNQVSLCPTNACL